MRKLKLFLAIAGIFALAIGISFAGQKTLEFEWDYPNPPSDLAGFRIYKSLTSGTYIPVSQDPQTTHLLVEIPYTGQAPDDIYQATEVLDSPDGQTTIWYFVATAFDNEGLESGFSNEVSARIDFEAPPTTINFKVRVLVQPTP